LDKISHLARLHLQHVRLLVPRFHIAHWTALHSIHGILLAVGLLGTDGAKHPGISSLSAEFAGCLDVAQVYDPEAASTFQATVDASSTNVDPMAEGSKLFQQMAQDPSKLAAFYDIDPELPMDQKMARMAQLL